MENNEKENFIIAISLFVIAIVFIIIGTINWVNNPNSIMGLAGYYFGGQFVGMGREIIKK